MPSAKCQTSATELLGCPGRPSVSSKAALSAALRTSPRSRGSSCPWLSTTGIAATWQLLGFTEWAKDRGHKGKGRAKSAKKGSCWLFPICWPCRMIQTPFKHALYCTVSCCNPFKWGQKVTWTRSLRSEDWHCRQNAVSHFLPREMSSCSMRCEAQCLAAAAWSFAKSPSIPRSPGFTPSINRPGSVQTSSIIRLKHMVPSSHMMALWLGYRFNRRFSFEMWAAKSGRLAARSNRVCRTAIQTLMILFIYCPYICIDFDFLPCWQKSAWEKSSARLRTILGTLA